MNTIAISDLRSDLPSIIDKISKNRERLTITVYGKARAVVISNEEYESLLARVNNRQSVKKPS